MPRPKKQGNSHTQNHSLIVAEKKKNEETPEQKFRKGGGAGGTAKKNSRCTPYKKRGGKKGNQQKKNRIHVGMERKNRLHRSTLSTKKKKKKKEKNTKMRKLEARRKGGGKACHGLCDQAKGGSESHTDSGTGKTVRKRRGRKKSTKYRWKRIRANSMEPDLTSCLDMERGWAESTPQKRKNDWVCKR